MRIAADTARDAVAAAHRGTEPRAAAHSAAATERVFDIDVIVFATGFDAMTGAIRSVHPIMGRGGKSLSDVWAISTERVWSELFAGDEGIGVGNDLDAAEEGD